ncbi:MAG: hypothetical protein ACRD0A_01940 [Acidimicrobiales bacterium]
MRLIDGPEAVDEFTDAVAEAYGGEHLPSINVGQGEESVRDSISVVTGAAVLLYDEQVTFNGVEAITMTRDP